MRRVSWSVVRSWARYVASTLRTPGWSFDAMSTASCRANGSSSSCGTTWFTRPQVSAVGASRKFPVTLISRARRCPTASASSTVRPQPGMIPTRACVSAKRRTLRRDQEVAGQRDLEPAGHRRPVDRADHRLRRLRKRAVDLLVGLHDVLHVGVAAEGLQIDSRAERRICTREHDRVDVVIARRRRRSPPGAPRSAPG